MPQPFSAATAEQVISVVESVVVNPQFTEIDFVANFSQLPRDRAKSALELADDLSLLSLYVDSYQIASPLCRFILTPDQKQKAAVLRIILESYVPFTFFRERLIATMDAPEAARQTQIRFDLDAHREEVKDTLISLGTYSSALITEGGGHYSITKDSFSSSLETLAKACANVADAEVRIRDMLGNEAAEFSHREEVILPLASALMRANANDPRGAVVEAGNAVESFLTERATRLGVSIAGAHGINAKIDKFDNAAAGANRLPKKLVFMGKYLGHIRNAADHGIDADIGTAWQIRNATGLEYVHIACSFLATITRNEKGGVPEV